MQQLEKGKLYQLKVPGKGWVIAEYHAGFPAAVVSGYRSSDGARSWREPAKHMWKNTRGGMEWVIYDRGMQTRPVTEETVAEIQRLREEIKRKGEEQQSLIKQLIGLCA